MISNYICHFFLPLLITYLFFFKHVVSPIRLTSKHIQKVPLPPSIFNRSCHIEGNVDLGWGEK